MVGWSGGQDINEEPFGSFSVSYQWRLGNEPNFISIGISPYATIYDEMYYTYSGDFVCCRDETYQTFMPILSFDRRF